MFFRPEGGDKCRRFGGIYAIFADIGATLLVVLNSLRLMKVSKSKRKYFLLSFLAYLFLLVCAIPGEPNIKISSVLFGFPFLFTMFYIAMHAFCLNFWFYKNTSFLPASTLTVALFVVFVAITKGYIAIFSLPTILSLVFLTTYISKYYELSYCDAKVAEEAEEIAEELF